MTSSAVNETPIPVRRPRNQQGAGGCAPRRQNTFGAAGVVPASCPRLATGASTLATYWGWHRHSLAGSRRGHQYLGIARRPALRREHQIIEALASVATPSA